MKHILAILEYAAGWLLADFIKRRFTKKVPIDFAAWDRELAEDIKRITKEAISTRR